MDAVSLDPRYLALARFVLAESRRIAPLALAVGRAAASVQGESQKPAQRTPSRPKSDRRPTGKSRPGRGFTPFMPSGRRVG